MKEEKKTEIKKLVIEVDGKEISLPVDKAKKLYEALGELFAKKVEIKEIHHDHCRTISDYWYWKPYYTTTDIKMPNYNRQVWCADNQTKFTMQTSTKSLLCQVK